MELKKRHLRQRGNSVMRVDDKEGNGETERERGKEREREGGLFSGVLKDPREELGTK